jgi:SAM-dependent methyltransferase
MSSLLGGVQWGLDRMVAVGYGVVYDYIFEQFKPYQALKTEVLDLVEAAVPDGANRRDVRVLDVVCGPGNFTVSLAEAGFSVVGMDPYGALVELAREKRRARHLANLAFRHGDLADGGSFNDESFDQVVNVHSLYLHPSPERLLKEAHRVLRPGGQAVFVNRTRQVSQWSTVRDLKARDGIGAAMRSLVWVVPNSVFEATRRPVGPYYWNEDRFVGALHDTGFTVLELRRTFLNGSSLLAVARKDVEA